MSESPNSKGKQAVEELLSNPLELPDGSSFVSVTPKLPIQHMIALSEALLPVVNSQSDFIQKRRSLAIDMPFVL
jgi:hypothetical protein